MNSEKLKLELAKLKKLFNYGTELEVEWHPEKRKFPDAQKFSGEVLNNIILIYDQDESRALETLRHEFLDHVLTTELVNPLVGLINLLVKEREREIYTKKERLVKRLSTLFQIKERGSGT